MKKIIKFKKNIFEKINIMPFTPTRIISNNIQNIINLKHDLINIRKTFGKKYKSREIWLRHTKRIPPKSSRCTNSILNLNNNNTLTTYLFNNFEKETKIELITVINFKKNTLDEQVHKLNDIISFLQVINKKWEIKFLYEYKKSEYPTWLISFMKKIHITKTYIIDFLNNIQNYYKEIRFPDSDIKLEGDLIISFSSSNVANEFKKNNNLLNNEFKEINYDCVLVNSKLISDYTNIKSIYKNVSISILQNNSNNIINGPLINQKKVDISAYTIGVLDSKIPNNSIYKPYLKVRNLLDNDNDVIHHGESVSSIAMFGDLLNNFDDGCGEFNVELFEIFENNINTTELIKRIRLAISTRYKDIKVWNLSINSIYQNAWENGEPTWFASQLDSIQEEFDVIIVQSAGNTSDNSSSQIKSPSDALHSLVVASVEDLNTNKASHFSLNGYGQYTTQKPDIAFFGGGKFKKVKVIRNGRIHEDVGTSFAAPFIARKMAYLVYHEGYSILEAKSLLIHCSYKNLKSNSRNKIGWGVCPINIKDIINTPDDEIRVIFVENIDSTKKAFWNIKIPEGESQEFSTYLTYISENNTNIKYGCEYVRSAINLSYGPLKNKKIVPGRKVKPHIISNENNDVIATERRLIKVFGKWKTVFCGEDIIMKHRKTYGEGYGISAKLDKRMNLIKTDLHQKIVCIITIKNINGLDLYKEFINKNIININIDIKNSINLKGDLLLKLS